MGLNYDELMEGVRRENKLLAVPNLFRVLYVDGRNERANMFRVKSTMKLPYLVRICRSRERMDIELESNSWDLVILSDYIPYMKTHSLSNAERLMSAYNQGKLKGVVVTDPDLERGSNMVKVLKEEGVPALLVPYLPETPSQHVVVGVLGAKLEVCR